MSEQRQIVFEKLNELEINYDLIEHPAVYTIEEMDALNISNKNQIVKNLFLRDDKKEQLLLSIKNQPFMANRIPPLLPKF